MSIITEITVSNLNVSWVETYCEARPQSSFYQRKQPQLKQFWLLRGTLFVIILSGGSKLIILSGGSKWRITIDTLNFDERWVFKKLEKVVIA